MIEANQDEWGAARLSALAAVNCVAETQFMLRPMLMSALDNQVLTPEGQQIHGNAFATFGEMWRHGLGDRFFDMGTLLRLGASIEDGLRYSYLRVAGKSKFDERITKRRDSRGLFQRLANDDQDVVDLFKEVGYDLSSNPNWLQIRLIIAHRHLYAHRNGQVDAQYVKQLLSLTGEDISPGLKKLNWPDEIIYWFRPLNDLSEMIEQARSFFSGLGRT